MVWELDGQHFEFNVISLDAEIHLVMSIKELEICHFFGQCADETISPKQISGQILVYYLSQDQSSPRSKTYKKPRLTLN